MVLKQNTIESNSQHQILKLFWLGFIIYLVTYISIHLTPGISSFSIPLLLQSVGLILIFSTSFFLLKWRFGNRFNKGVFILYMLWLILIVIRGLSSDFRFVKLMLFDASFGLMPYLTPLILLFPKKLSTYRQLFNVIIIFGVLYLVYIAIFSKNFFTWDRRGGFLQGFIENLSAYSIPVGFILFTYKYHPLKVRIFSFIIFAVGLFLAIYGARRNLIFIYSTQIIFLILLYLVLSKRKIILIIYSFFIFFLLVYYLNNTFLKKDNPIFGFLVERGLEDTRTGVEMAFYADLNKVDWIIGKGISGTYYCPGIEDNRNYRYVIETGYLQIILRGGLISLILILLISIPSALLGLFYSANLLSKAGGIWILLWILYLYPTRMESFSLFYIIFWISIGICNSKKIRQMSDLQIIRELYFLEKPDKRILFDT